MLGKTKKLKFKNQVFFVKFNKKETNFFSFLKANCLNQKN